MALAPMADRCNENCHLQIFTLSLGFHSPCLLLRRLGWPPHPHAATLFLGHELRTVRPRLKIFSVGRFPLRIRAGVSFTRSALLAQHSTAQHDLTVRTRVRVSTRREGLLRPPSLLSCSDMLSRSHQANNSPDIVSDPRVDPSPLSPHLPIMSRPRALVYRGPCTSDGLPEAVAKLLESSPQSFDVQYAGPGEAINVSSQSLSQVDLYAQPGGPGMSASLPFWEGVASSSTMQCMRLISRGKKKKSSTTDRVA
jgi:hypothetical protein